MPLSGLGLTSCLLAVVTTLHHKRTLSKLLVDQDKQPLRTRAAFLLIDPYIEDTTNVTNGNNIQ